jgi:hypothetical protein
MKRTTKGVGRLLRGLAHVEQKGPCALEVPAVMLTEVRTISKPAVGTICGVLATLVTSRCPP